MGTDEGKATAVPEGTGPLEYGFMYGVRDLMEQANAMGEWDQAPALILVGQQGGIDPEAREHIPEDVWAELPEELRARIESGEARLGSLDLTSAPVEIPDEIWGLRPAAEVISILATMVGNGEGVTMQTPDDIRIIGVMLVSEAWALRAQDMTPEEIERAKEMTSDGSINTHPNRVEVRTVVGVDLAGFIYHLSHLRDTGEQEELIDGPGIDGPSLSGAIPDALREFLHAVVGEPEL